MIESSEDDVESDVVDEEAGDELKNVESRGMTLLTELRQAECK